MWNVGLRVAKGELTKDRIEWTKTLGTRDGRRDRRETAKVKVARCRVEKMRNDMGRHVKSIVDRPHTKGRGKSAFACADGRTFAGINPGHRGPDGRLEAMALSGRGSGPATVRGKQPGIAGDLLESVHPFGRPEVKVVL
jgi:hypothetical protein